MENSRMSSTLQIGTSALVALATATTVLYAFGSLQVKDNINFTPDGTTSGAVLQVNGVTRLQTLGTQCSATGGLTSSTCAIRSPFTTSGSLLGFSIECGSFAVGVSGDVSFKKSLTTGSGSVLTNGNNLSVGSGALVASTLAQPVKWNSADILTFTTTAALTSTLNTTRYDCQMWAIVADKYGT